LTSGAASLDQVDLASADRLIAERLGLVDHAESDASGTGISPEQRTRRAIGW
jgi:hypothetical protein